MATAAKSAWVGGSSPPRAKNLILPAENHTTKNAGPPSKAARRHREPVDGAVPRDSILCSSNLTETTIPRHASTFRAATHAQTPHSPRALACASAAAFTIRSRYFTSGGSGDDSPSPARASCSLTNTPSTPIQRHSPWGRLTRTAASGSVTSGTCGASSAVSGPLHSAFFEVDEDPEVVRRNDPQAVGPLFAEEASAHDAQVPARFPAAQIDPVESRRHLVTRLGPPRIAGEIHGDRGHFAQDGMPRVREIAPLGAAPGD